ncbi:hypothetical protein OHA44_04100 [Streptomyces sp. NBC_00144]|uniref:hypothetical protein n=1 Tax=unclassified Streptomyces TaxID=2593676 RepID=UPI0032463569|nr:hypothetical protein OG221_04325 [Streptomyces sp. NBC_00932]
MVTPRQHAEPTTAGPPGRSGDPGEHPLLPLARRVARQLAAPATVGSSFIAGSVTAGLGNHTSDIDVYLVGTGLAPARRQLVLDRSRFDVQELSVADLDAAVGRVAGAAFPGDGSTVVAQRDLDLAVRLWSGEVITDDGALAPLRDRLRAAPLPLRRALITHWLTAVHYELEDVAGLVANGDLDAGLMAARTALLLAGKAVAAACGDFYTGRKWVWHQLRRAAPSGFPYEGFRHLLRYDPLADGTGAGGGSGTPAGGLPSLAGFTQGCLSAVATLGWHGIPLEHWPCWPGASDRPGESDRSEPGSTAPVGSQQVPGLLRRAPGFSPRAHSGGVVLALPALRRVRLNPDVALVWALCDGAPPSTVTGRAQKLREAHPAYAGLTPDRCAVIIERLVAARLVEAL